MDVIKSIQSQIANQNFTFVPEKCMRSLLFVYTNFSNQDEPEFRRFWDVAVPKKMIMRKLFIVLKENKFLFIPWIWADTSKTLPSNVRLQPS